jgi:hypothetical protein
VPKANLKEARETRLRLSRRPTVFGAKVRFRLDRRREASGLVRIEQKIDEFE